MSSLLLSSSDETLEIPVSETLFNQSVALRGPAVSSCSGHFLDRHSARVSSVRTQKSYIKFLNPLLSQKAINLTWWKDNYLLGLQTFSGFLLYSSSKNQGSGSLFSGLFLTETQQQVSSKSVLSI